MIFVRAISVLLVAIFAAHFASSYTCACFVNTADRHYLGLMCTAYYVPRMITGWGGPRNEWFSVDCSSCSVDYNCTKHINEEVNKAPLPPPPPLPVIASPPLPPAIKSSKKVQGKGDLVRCCCYAKKEYYYTKGIHCDALNPESGSICESEEYGAQLIGQWYVSDMFGNQCYFIVGENSLNSTTTRSLKH